MSAHNSSNTGSKTSTGMASQEKTPATAGIGEDKPKMFDAQGSIGKQFTEEGAIGGTAQKIGGPLDKEGMVGKQFTTEGSVGGSVQSKLGGQSGRSN
ncbi:hypothetical protein F5Y00DRAFT_258130 [Daldinia vernicosa]|uniref:uncharacterized protein n=1 Tax=Daldinia vernicosa TaxID=114800 RepID=UPI0020076D25|nr:uncharacterized protein F5Y00DRAFT_258130 [Daldinia vernicosa]KAI0852875.1 hypothetical protein F5Y00DRAFT_258130 [Daldinia vernicosa]